MKVVATCSKKVVANSRTKGVLAHFKFKKSKIYALLLRRSGALMNQIIIPKFKVDPVLF